MNNNPKYQENCKRYEAFRCKFCKGSVHERTMFVPFRIVSLGEDVVIDYLSGEYHNPSQKCVNRCTCHIHSGSSVCCKYCQKSKSPATPKLSDSITPRVLISREEAERMYPNAKLQPSTGEDWEKGWKKIKDQYSQSGLFDLAADAKDSLDLDVANLFRSLLQQERDKVEEIRQLRQDDFARRRTLTEFAVMAERERCAKICEETKMEEPHLSNTDRGYLWNRALDAAKQQILKDNQ